MGMFDMIGKLGEMKKAIEAAKQRLDTIYVQGSAGGDSVKVEMSANMEVKSVRISPELYLEDRREETEELLAAAINQAVSAARNVSESELKAAGKGFLPDIPGLF
jgi:nucleoid-associated protein EbfC